MANRILRALVIGLMCVPSWSIADAAWTISNLMNNSTVNRGDDIDCDGSCDSHPSSRKVRFGKYTTQDGFQPEQSVTTSSQEIMQGVWRWDCTLLEPGGGWVLSDLDGMGMPIPQHQLWVSFTVGTDPWDARTIDHTVIDP